MAMNQNERDKLTIVATDVEWIKRNMVTKAEFDPVKRVVYGAVGVTMSFVLLAILGVIIVRAAHT